MPYDLWGIIGAPQLMLPERPVSGYLFLALYLFVLVFLLFRQRDALRLSRRQWMGIVFLSLLGLTVAQLFPISISFERQLPPPGTAQNPETTLAVFGAIPFLLAGATLNPAAALIVGLFTGFGRALWRTHIIYDPFYFAFAAYLAGWCIVQFYEGRLFRWLRQPAVAGALGLVALAPLVTVGAFNYAGPEANWLVVLDWATSMTAAQLLTFLLEGIVGGAIVSLILVGVPQWRLQRPSLVPAPHTRSVRNRLLFHFGVFAVALSVLLVAVVFTLSVYVATQLSLNQMAHDARSVSERIPDFRNQVQNLLSEYGDAPELLGREPRAIRQRLERLTRTAGAVYRRVILVEDDGEIAAFYPNRDVDTLTLTPQETAAIQDALGLGAPTITAAQTIEDGEHVLSVVVPVMSRNGEPRAVLIGRIPALALDTLMVGLQGTVGAGSGFIVDEHGQVIAHPDEGSLLTPWTPPTTPQYRLRPRVEGPGTAYEGRESETNARELLFHVEGPNHPWQVVITVPYQVVLRLALEISAPLMGVLAIAMLIFALNLVYLGRTITHPLARLVQASQQLAAGRWDAAVPVEESDEVGQLGHAFERMRRSMRRQFNDIKLMLDVSQDISTSIDINQGIPTILRGALRGTGAQGARAVVLNPTGRYPLRYAEGDGEEMALLDRKIALLARQKQEIVLSTPEEIRRALQIGSSQPLPVDALLAIGLQSEGRFQGVFWIGYRQAHHFAPAELTLLRTMASQASVLVDNARLFATAEGQRRRLAAVLASTSDAVIVTDQTERVLLINRAMERTFALRTGEVVGRPVADVIDNENLVRALTEHEDRVRNLELSLEGGRTLYASVSTIVSNEGQVLGRVAVLHDITHLKELDDLKSEFVSTVSHDLRGPLTFMRGYLTMIPMVGEINEKQRLYIDKIQSGVQQMSALIEDLLDLGRIEAGVDLMRDTIHAHELLRNVAWEYSEQAAANGIEFRVEADFHLPAISGDISLVRRAISNLVGNAMKYAPDSGVVTLRAVRDGDEIIFSVQDKGPGIAKEDQIRLFEKFYRAQSVEWNGTKGSGLGLAIVRSIVERHGGRVWVHSQVGRGSTFYFSLPVKGQGSDQDDEAR